MMHIVKHCKMNGYFSKVALASYAFKFKIARVVPILKY